MTSKPTRWMAFEPWLRAWLILAPLVAWGSHFIVRNARLRLAQLKAHSLDVPEPQGTWGYAAACTVAFTLLMLALARVWVQSTPIEDNGEQAA